MKLYYGILFILFAYASYGQESDIRIIVNKGDFKTVNEAANGENSVNFLDKDFSDDYAVTECYAATELANFLSRITNTSIDKIDYYQPAKIPKSGNIFILGSKNSNKLISSYHTEIDSKFTSEQSFSIRSYQNKDRVITIIEGAGRIGTLYGVYSYLEQLGVGFIGLGDKGITYPEPISSFPDSIDRYENPSYLTRGYWVRSDQNAIDNVFFTWMARNKMNFWTTVKDSNPLLKKLGIKLTDGGHGIQMTYLDPNGEYQYNHPIYKGDEAKPTDPYASGVEYLGDEDNDKLLTNFEAHPEWYGLRNGKRSKNIVEQRGDNFCTSNIDARKELSKNMVQSLISGNWKYIDVVNFWMTDFGNWCTCQDCRDDGSETDRLFTVVNEFINEIKIAREKDQLNRKVEVSAIAYGETLAPPTKPLPVGYDYENSSITFFPIHRCYAHTFADPSCTEINEHQLSSYNGWASGQNYKGSICIGEYYNVSSLMNLPVVFSKIISTDVPWFYKNGAKHFHYMHTPRHLWGTWTLNQYLLSKVLWNVNINTNKLLNNYFKAYYPTTNTTTRLFYEYLEKASANIKTIKHGVEIDIPSQHYNYRLARKLLNGDLFQPDHLSYDGKQKIVNGAPSIVETIEALENAKNYIEQSLLYCKNPTEQKRLIEDKSRFDYGYSMLRYIYHMVRTSMFHKAKNGELARLEFATVTEYKEKLEKVTELAQSAFTCYANSNNGFLATQSTKEYDEFNKLYGKE